mmetsp:Transcript_8113/g.9436  ORF Transcript_8113/g.9436 Transcript_8113/m.9436 type:complete len:229 (-) Transcript_8113:69-755(-)|eukprot:CAMPEP_0204639988 /NCGR_PEP_ID=MMETSP0717-20131115/45206_1 /ASSEMBLY_ACC=CAM_ASM_000666 /TAXON_ID=230516 /ORGANISM="Chaetoceros curvisetus" /LENGTH=228 /DNA_ID=CAMNT_0051660265 /DNA_START=549 /DNA_END=1235 /DNA_ORIENTATION=+
MKKTTVPPIVTTNKNNSISDWPEAWLMQPGVKQLKAMNRMSPNIPIPADALCELGISYYKVGPDAFSSPVQSVPWNHQEQSISQKRRESGDYSYANIITLHSDNFSGDDRHDREHAIAYVLVGSGFLDVCASDDYDSWVRIHVQKGDLLTLPEDLYHRFIAGEENNEDEVDQGKAESVRYFAGQPFWTPLVRIVIEENAKIMRRRHSKSSRSVGGDRCAKSTSTATAA